MPIKFPDFCYKSVSESSAMLSDVAIGPPNIPASLAEGHVRYEAPQEVSKKKPKTLIFNALKWFEVNYNELKRGQFFATLHQLLQEGFDVFIPVDPPTYLERLDHCRISPFFLESCTKIHSSSVALLQRALQMQLNGKHTYDDFLVLDDDNLTQIIEFIEKQPDAENSAHLYEDDMSKEDNKIYSLAISKTSTSKKTIYQNTIEFHSELTSDYTLADVDNIFWKEDWLPSSSQDSEDWLLKSLSPKGITLWSPISTSQDNQLYLRRFLPYTSSLNVPHDATLEKEILMNYLSNTPRLESFSMNLEYCELDEIPIKPKLRELNLICCSPKTIKAFLSGSPNLMELNLENAFILRINEILKQLKTLPKLQKLYLTDPVVYFHGDDLSEKETLELIYPLPQLQSITVQIKEEEDFGATIYLTALIINSAPNLRFIDLTHCPNLVIKKILEKIPNFLKKQHRELLLPDRDSSTKTEWERGDHDDIDADTSPKEVIFTPKTLFQGIGCDNPIPNNYRLGVTSNFTVSPSPCPINKAFSLHYSDPVSLKDAPTHPASAEEMQQQLITLSVLQSKDKFYHSQIKLRLTTNWKPLPSLKSYDEMLCHSLIDSSGALINEAVEIKYCETDNLYYIHTKESTLAFVDVVLDFIIKNEQEKIEKDHVASDHYVESLWQFFNSFSEQKPLDMAGKENALGQEYADAIISQHTGACRHRAIACLYWMQKDTSEYKVRYIKNEVHAYVEIKPPKLDWITVDLGGATQGVTLLPQPFGVKGKKTPFIRFYFPHRELPIYENTEAYCSDLLGHKENCLLETVSHEETNKMIFLLQENAQRKRYSCFVVNNPDELTCPATSIRLLDDQLNAELVQQHGGPLHRFLTDKTADSRLLIINFEQFSASDKVRCNTAFDQEANIDGVPIPSNTQVIVIGAESNADSSLSSRFSRIEKHLPYCVREFELPSLFVHDEAQSSGVAKPKDKKVVIDLYGSIHWQKRLLGEWHLHGSRLAYVKGPLLLALEHRSTSITILNPPMDNSDYEHFWQQLLLTKKITYCNGLAEVEIPEGFNISERIEETLSPNVLDVIQKPIHQGLPPMESLVLNPRSFRNFFYHDVIDNTHKLLHQEAGILFDEKVKSLVIYVSDDLSLENWRELLITCQHQGIKINLVLAPNIEPPLFLKQHLIEYPPVPVEDKLLFAAHNKLKNKVNFIHSSDRDVTIKQLEAINPSIISIDLSELEENDLLEHVSGFLDKEATPPKFSFQKRRGALLEALSQNKTVILHGTLSQSLQNALTTWYIEEEKQTLHQGQLIIISEKDHNPFIGLHGISSFSHQVTPEEKEALLPLPAFPEQYEHYDWSIPLVKLIALCRSDTSDPWAGMYSLSSLINTYPNRFIEENDLSIEQANDFLRKRESLIEHVLAKSPYVFLAGVSGVGKTTFVRDYFKEGKGTLYEGENNIRHWAESVKPGRKILFIDEANITTKNWSQFEGLFSASPHIVIDGLAVPLTPEHRVIFAGNPIAYSEDRHQPLLFERHGNSVVFEPLSLAFIYQRVLKPILEQMDIHDEVTQKAIGIPILQAAVFLTKLSVDTILITPRELETIALLTAIRCHPPETRFSEIANHYIVMIVKTFVPKAHLHTFEGMFPTLPELLNIPESSSNFTFTPTNVEAGQIINDFLALRDYQQRLSKKPRKVQGLGGVIIEGEPGIGKSMLAKTILEERGLRAPFQGNWRVTNPEAKMYYHVTSTMSINDKEELLLKAFDEGAVVIWDEMNSSSSMERLLNALLMGTTPKGIPPQKPGFFLISTQNPSSMPGRQDTSAAIQHRMHYRVVPMYPDEEAAIILRNIGWVPMGVSKAIIEEKTKITKEGDSLSFRDAVKASQEAAKKDPCGKETLQVAEQEIRHEKMAVYTKEREHLIQEMSLKEPRNLFFSSAKKEQQPPNTNEEVPNNGEQFKDNMAKK